MTPEEERAWSKKLRDMFENNNPYKSQVTHTTGGMLGYIQRVNEQCFAHFNVPAGRMRITEDDVKVAGELGIAVEEDEILWTT